MYVSLNVYICNVIFNFNRAMKKIFLGSFWALLFFSCAQNQNLSRIGTDEYRMEVAGGKSFYLDSLTTQETNYIQQINDTTIAFYNKPVNTICVFNIPSTKQQATIRLYKEGPNAVYDIQGFYYQSADSIWLHQYWKKELVLVNDSGVIQNHLFMKTSKETRQYSADPLPGTDDPITKIDNKIILQGMNGPEVEQGFIPAATVVYDLDTKQTQVANPYPAIYGDSKEINKNWDAIAYRLVRYTLSPNKEMVLSYPADDSVRVYDVKKNITRSFFAGTTQENHIRPYTPKSKVEGLKKYLEHSQYAGIWYDKYRHVYYRLVSLSTSDYTVDDESTYIKPLGIILLNDSFQKIGEYHLERGNYRYRNCFVSQEGFHINIPSEDDDYLKFLTLKPVKK